MSDCIFCRIASKEIPATILYEDDLCMIFSDINPKAKNHWLTIPNKHIPTIIDIEKGDEALIGHMVEKSRDLAVSKGLKGYKLQFNVGEAGGQEVMHVHMHLLAN